MAWQFAREYSESKGCNVLIIGFESKFNRSFPLPMRREDEKSAFWSMEVLEKIELKSINSSRELKEVLSAIHCFQKRPKLIIVEDLSDLVGKGSFRVSLSTSIVYSSFDFILIYQLIVGSVLHKS